MGTKATITVLRVGGGSGEVEVDYATADGTATAGSDYTSAAGSLKWLSGDKANKTFTVSILPDTLDESNETFAVTVKVKLTEPPSDTILGSPDSATVTIVDDDLPPKVQFTLATAPVAEATTPALITVGLFSAATNLPTAAAKTITVKFATANGTAKAGTDYMATAGTLTFAPGDTTKTIEVPIVDDPAVESEEYFTVTLATPVNATLGAIPRHTCKIAEMPRCPSVEGARPGGERFRR